MRIRCERRKKLSRTTAETTQAKDELDKKKKELSRISEWFQSLCAVYVCLQSYNVNHKLLKWNESKKKKTEEQEQQQNLKI